MIRDTRLWMYRKGEARLFGHPSHVPEGEDWQRFPAVEHQPEEEEARDQGAGEAGRSGGLSNEELDRMSRRRLTEVALDCGVRFETGWSKAQLKQAIIEVRHDNRA